MFWASFWLVTLSPVRHKEELYEKERSPKGKEKKKNVFVCMCKKFGERDTVCEWSLFLEVFLEQLKVRVREKKQKKKGVFSLFLFSHSHLQLFQKHFQKQLK